MIILTSERYFSSHMCQVYTKDWPEGRIMSDRKLRLLDRSRLHRSDGPAVEWGDGAALWYVDGKRHRLSGPAAIWSSGFKDWWIDGKMIPTNEVMIWLREQGLNEGDLMEERNQLAFHIRFIDNQ